MHHKIANETRQNFTLPLADHQPNPVVIDYFARTAARAELRAISRPATERQLTAIQQRSRGLLNEAQARALAACANAATALGALK